MNGPIPMVSVHKTLMKLHKIRIVTVCDGVSKQLIHNIT